MHPQLQAFWSELQQESAATRRMLQAVPADRLSWKPHPKSMSLGQLALEVARVPGAIVGFVESDSFDASAANFDAPSPETKEHVLAALDGSLAEVERCFNALTDARIATPWKLLRKDELLMEMPRLALIRSLMLNHVYHHRGQLSVYLRLLDAPVPAMYGRSADESLFG